MSSVVKGEKHLTASIWFVTSSQPRKVLLVHHRKFDKWIQPGGHVDFDENPVETAVREAREETGIDISYLLDEIKPASDTSVFLPVPDYFMEHKIPAYGDQPGHFHLDVMYVVQIKEQHVTLREKESLGIKWFTKEEIAKLPMHENSRQVIYQLLDK